jgi:hypothetical protein
MIHPRSRHIDTGPHLEAMKVSSELALIIKKKNNFIFSWSREAVCLQVTFPV